MHVSAMLSCTTLSRLLEKQRVAMPYSGCLLASRDSDCGISMNAEWRGAQCRRRSVWQT